MIVTTLASFASIFVRINWEFQIGLFLGAVILVIIGIARNNKLPNFSLKNFSLLQKVGFIVFCGVFLLIFYAATLTPANADTGIYHAQMIHWIETYPAVPGLVNLHQRLGYDSSWLLANAIFSFSFLNIQSFHLLTGAFFLIMVGNFYQGIHELLGKKYSFSNFLKLGFFLCIFIFLFDQISSPGTDAPATLLIWFLIAQSIQFLENLPEEQSLQSFFLVLLIFFCITIKISSAPLFLLALGLIIPLIRVKKFREIGLTALFSGIILLPFVIRNIILTGYPIFPGFPIDLFNLDWKLPVEKVKEESRVIHWFATLSNMSQGEFESLSWRDQTIQWFYNQLPRHKAILLFILASLPINILLCIFKEWRKFIKKNLDFWIVYLTIIAGSVFWFFSAPAIRFGYGFLLAAVFLLGLPVFVFMQEKFPILRRITNWLVLIVCVGVIGMSIRSDIKFNKISETIILPADYPIWSSEPCSFANFKLLCQASYDSCWYSPFPCAIRSNEHVEMRGEDYRDGFRYLP